MMKNLLFLAGGLGLGYYVAKKTLEKEYADLAMQEIADAKNYYESLANKAQAVLKENIDADISAEELLVELPKTRVELPGISSAEALMSVEVAANAMKNYQGLSMSEKATVDKPVVEEKKRPIFVISQEDFMNNEDEWDQKTLTYYEGDKILEGQDQDVVDEVGVSVTEECLTKFGFDSGDPHVVYVRNEELEILFEVCQSMGKYSVEVLGKPDVDAAVSADSA